MPFDYVELQAHGDQPTRFPTPGDVPESSVTVGLGSFFYFLSQGQRVDFTRNGVISLERKKIIHS